MEANQTMYREKFGLMSMLGSVIPLFALLVMYLYVDDFPTLGIYLLLALFILDFIFGTLIWTGKILKNIPSKYDMQRRI